MAAGGAPFITLAVFAVSTLASAALGSTSQCEPAANPGYSLDVAERSLGPGGGAVISMANGTSSFDYSFTTAYFPGRTEEEQDGLVVRVGSNTRRPWFTGFAVVRRLAGSQAFEHVDSSKMLIDCENINGSSGHPTALRPCADDPRIVYRAADKTYYMTYQNSSGLEYGSTRITWIGTSQTPWDRNSWTYHSPTEIGLSPRYNHTAGMSIVLQDGRAPKPTHVAFFMTANTAGALYAATSTDLLHWDVGTEPWCAGRAGHFDHGGIAAGPQAERLSDGNLLYLYSLDNVLACQSSSCGKCGVNCSDPAASCGGGGRCTDGRCSLGWMILDGNDPLKVIARATETLIFPTLPFETGQGQAPPFQTPWVVFTTGLQRVGVDEFVVWYGAGDTNVGAARIKVTVPAPRHHG